MAYGQVNLTEGTGPKASATDVVDGKHVQIVKAHIGGENQSLPITADTPMPVVALGELLEAMEALRFAVQALTTSIGAALPSAQGWPIMEARQPTAANFQATVSGTVTANVGTGTLTNQAQMGGFATNDYMVALMHMQADGLRANISVT